MDKFKADFNDKLSVLSMLIIKWDLVDYMYIKGEKKKERRKQQIGKNPKSLSAVIYSTA